MQKLLIICGPTGIGKTNLALHLAKEFNGELISADSRQVYKGMDIGTGKDWGDGDVPIWGYDIADPTDVFSVSDYVDFARSAIVQIVKNKKLPIVVGGTGFYIGGLIDGIDSIGVAPNIGLRKSLDKFPASELYEKLAQLDPIKAASLNVSDKRNPRRLIRAIEIAQHNLSEKVISPMKPKESDTLFVGLKVDKASLEQIIKERVLKRVSQGIEGEIKKLLTSGVNWSDKSMSGMGYRQWEGYFKKMKSKDEVIDDWISDEIKYTKRQMVWFKKDKRIKWFDVGGIDFQKNVENEVEKWYS